MVKYMKIGILTRKLNSNTNVLLNSIPFTYLNVISKEHFPILIDSTISLEKHKQDIINQIKDIDGFILPGGSDISEIDLFIIDYCYKNNLPLLGICLGMQEIGYYFNKKKIKPLKDLTHFDIKKEYLHTISLNKKGYLYSLLKKGTIPVNSRHKYHLLDDKHYTIEATCNNIIEAIKVKNKSYILGVQFHPEIMYEYDDNAKIIFNDFFKHCKKKKSESLHF